MYLQQYIGPISSSISFGGNGITITQIGIEVPQTAFYPATDTPTPAIDTPTEHTNSYLTISNINDGNTIYVNPGDILEYDNLATTSSIIINNCHNFDNGIINIGYEINE